MNLDRFPAYPKNKIHNSIDYELPSVDSHPTETREEVWARGEELRERQAKVAKHVAKLRKNATRTIEVPVRHLTLVEQETHSEEGRDQDREVA